MSANETAEAILIVIKRLLKWVAIAALLVMVVLGTVLGYDHYEQYQRKKPRLATEYAGVKLGETRQQLLYALGEPVQIELSDMPRQEHVAGEREKLMAASAWWYSIRTNPAVQRIAVFGKESQSVSLIVCFSDGYADCPELFGLRDGSREEEVLEHLGPADKEEVTDSIKVLVYNKLNAQFYLRQKVVYGVQVAKPID
jgi:hypothetical protein